MNCADLDSLQAKYKQEVDEFTETIKKLCVATLAEYAALSDMVERTKAKAEAAQRELRNHIIEHGCC